MVAAAAKAAARGSRNTVLPAKGASKPAFKAKSTTRSSTKLSRPFVGSESVREHNIVRVWRMALRVVHCVCLRLELIAHSYSSCSS